jgi:AraC-like DNA-binding protein
MKLFDITVEPIWITRVNLEKGNGVKEHMHKNYYHLVYVNSGYLEFMINNQPYIISDNMLTIARPGDTQGWYNKQNNTAKTYEIKFTVFDNDLKYAIKKLPDILYGNPFQKTILKKILREIKEDNDYCMKYIGLYLKVLIYDLVRSKIADSINTDENMRILSPSQAAIRYIHDNYHTDLSLEKISKAINFNKTYLSAAFKKSEGITVGDYIYRYRIHKACELIAYGDLQLSQVSYMTGFKHIQHFNRIFKKYIGIPPGEYRDATPKEIINYKRFNNRFNTEVFPVRSGRVYEVESQTGYYRPKEDV